MTTDLVPTNGAAIAEQAAIAGDLAKLTPDQRMSYYGEVCRSLGLNPLTRPFEYIVLNDKLALYARRDATDQLRKIHGVNISIVARETVEGVYVVTARATTADGRSDESVGAVPLVKEDGEWKTSQNGKRYFAGNGQYKQLGPDDRANAMMKAETKAKRRVTLSIVGLGWIDESELGSFAKPVQVNYDTGEIIDPPANGNGAQPPAAQPDPLRAGLIAEMRDLVAKARAAGFTVPMMRPKDMTTEQIEQAIRDLQAQVEPEPADAEPIAQAA